MIELKKLSFGYRASAPLFAGLDLEISSGGIYGLLGKNGAGKTTLLKLITGLLFSKGGIAELWRCNREDGCPNSCRRFT